MITDACIDELNAKYYCIFASLDMKNLIQKCKENISKKSKEKEVMKLAVKKEKIADEIASLEKDKHTNESRHNILESIFTDPNVANAMRLGIGGNPYTPRYKTDTYDPGISMHDQQINSAIGGAAGAIVGTAVLAPEVAASAALATGKAAKTLGKGALTGAKALTGFALKHPTLTSIAVMLGYNAENIPPFLEKLGKLYEFFEPAIDFCSKHAKSLSIAGSVIFGLYKTYDLWSPYFRRACYELSSGKPIASCDFTANEQKYTFEYTLEKQKWVLLTRGHLADKEDVFSFRQTEFCKKFIDQCSKYIS